MKRVFRARDYQPDADRDLSDELRAHLELMVDDLVEKGMPEEKARGEALRSLNRGKGAHATAAPQARSSRNRRSRLPQQAYPHVPRPPPAWGAYRMER